jgi:hypothetical protein
MPGQFMMICGGKSRTGTSFPEYFDFALSSTIPPTLHNHLNRSTTLTRRTRRRNLGKHSNALAVTKQWTEKYFHTVNADKVYYWVRKGLITAVDSTGDLVDKQGNQQTFTKVVGSTNTVIVICKTDGCTEIVKLSLRKHVV